MHQFKVHWALSGVLNQRKNRDSVADALFGKQFQKAWCTCLLDQVALCGHKDPTPFTCTNERVQAVLVMSFSDALVRKGSIVWRFLSGTLIVICVKFLRAQVASQSWVRGNILLEASSRKAFYGVAVELGKAAQLCVFILGMGYLSLGVLRCVFGVRYAVYVLIIWLRNCNISEPGYSEWVVSYPDCHVQVGHASSKQTKPSKILSNL